MTKEEIQQLNEPELIELLENTDESWQKSEIISCLTDDDKKIELLDRFSNARETIVIASLDSDDKKVALLDRIKYEGDKALIIESLKSEETKIKLLDILSDYAKSNVILSIADEDRKIELLGKLKNDGNKARVITRLKSEEKRIELLEGLTDSAKKNVVLSLTDSNIRARLVSTISDEKFKLEIILGLENEDKRISLIDEILDDKIKVKIISSLSNDNIKISLLDKVKDTWNKVEVITSIESDDKKIEILDNLTDNMAKLQIVISVKNKARRDELLSRPENQKYEQTLQALYEKNNEVMENIDVRLLQEKYVQTLGEDKINYISCYTDVQQQILMLGNNQYELFQRCLNNYLTINKTEDWTMLASSILSNISEYSTLIDNIQDFENIDIEKLTKIIQDKNIFQIETLGDITRYEEIKRERCNEIIQNSENVEEIKAAVLQKIFGHSLEYARVIIDKFGEDIEYIEDSDEKYYVMSLKQIMDIDQIDMLYKMYDECEEVGLIDKTLIDRSLKSKYAKLFNKDLYEPSEETQMQYEDFESVIPIEDDEKRKEIYGELQKLKIYNAGNNFKMMVTSVATFMENAPSDFKQDWNRPAVASQHFCASYIRQDKIKTIKIPYVCYGFTNMSEDSLALSGTHDIGSSGISDFVSNSYGAEKYYSPDTQIEKTDLYNEMDFRRVQNGERKQPNYIVAFKRDGKIDNLEMIIKAAKDWEGNIPIIIIDVDECEQNVEKQIQNQSEEQTITIQDMEENDTQVTAEERKEGISQIKQLYSKLKQLTMKRTGEDIEK